MLYFDTDSIIFSHRHGQLIPPLGDHLREFTSELKAGDHIVEFAAAGPKNYGYKTKDGKVECKVRGFTLNTHGQEQLNFDLLKQNVIDEVTEPEEDPREIRVHNPHKIKRDANTKTLQTVEETKRYKVVFDKRVVDPETFRSYPYGYEKQVTVLDDDPSQAQAAQLDDVDMVNVELLLDIELKCVFCQATWSVVYFRSLPVSMTSLPVFDEVTSSPSLDPTFGRAVPDPFPKLRS